MHFRRAVAAGVDIAVVACGHRRGIRHGGVVLAVVDHDVGPGATAEADHVIAVVMPVGHTCGPGDIVPADHAANRRPPLRARPIRACAACGVGNGCLGRPWGSVVRFLVFVAGEDVRRAVRVGEHEGVGQQIGVFVSVCQGHAVAFGIPIGDEYRRVTAGHQIARDVFD